VTGLERDGVVAYRGIPYAAPPLGNLRWTGPQPAPPWSEPLTADGFCPDCMQVAGPDDDQASPSEDCLCLNVWKPADSLIDALLPVMVWIHGGGYVGGGSSDPTYDGATFARQGIVVVSVNYRLGRFGFFAPSALLANTDGPYGNYGYLDQIAALRWIQENITSFGGDPHRVTVAGESAGGASILHLMTSPAVEGGLFQQAVILSGGGREALLDRPMEGASLLAMSATSVDDLFAASVGVVGNGQEQLEKLRALPADKLVDDLDLEKLIERRLIGATLPGVPAVDGEIVVGQPQEHVLDGTAKLMPVIIGTTGTDVPTHFPPNKLHPLGWFGPDEDAAREAYGHGNDRFLGLSELIELNLSIGADLTMHEPAHFIAGAMQNAGFPAWVYRFTYTAESTRPEHVSQIHAGELPFLFDTLASSYGEEVTVNDRATATAFHTYVANFIHRGDPNGDGLPEWPAATPGAFDVMDFTLDDGPVYGPDPRPSVALVAAARERHINENLP
jgi:para-nitrobenzyl esterase